MKILPSDNSYATFCNITTGYRMFRVMEQAVRSGIIDRLDSGDCAVDELVTATGLKPDEGERFVKLLVDVGLEEEYDNRLCLSRFSKNYLTRQSPASQRQVLEFEPLLMENWERLGDVLRDGQGSLIVERTPDEESEEESEGT